MVPLADKPKVEMSLASVNTGGLSYTDSSTIRMGAPCDMATASLIGTPQRLLGNNLRNASSSLPRSLRNSKSPHEDLETQSKFSVSSARSGHSKASSRQRRHKKPNRRRPRQSKDNKSEPIYNNLNRNNEDHDYLGDDDQFDSLDRHKAAEYPSVIHEVEGDEEELEVDTISQGREEPASLEDLQGLADLSKRETSV